MSYIIVMTFIVLDIATGVILNLKRGSFVSSKMREGLYNKCGEILVLGFGALVDFGAQYVDFGVTISVSPMFCAYIVIMEIGSIIENIGKISPQIMTSNLKQHFAKLKGDETDENNNER